MGSLDNATKYTITWVKIAVAQNASIITIVVPPENFRLTVEYEACLIGSQEDFALENRRRQWIICRFVRLRRTGLNRIRPAPQVHRKLPWRRPNSAEMERYLDPALQLHWPNLGRTLWQEWQE
jgi:hypothetical protein